MADEMLDEYEQGEQARKWLKENALSLVLGVALGLAGLVGWQQWQVYQLMHKAEAAVEYDALISELGAGLAATEQRSTDLAENYSDTAYATLAQMHLAAQYLAEDNREQAIAAYQEAVRVAALPQLKSIAQLRLARLLLADGQAQEAINQVAELSDGAFAGAAKEVEGDALVAIGKTDEARLAYQSALDSLQSDYGLRQMIDMKLKALGES
ncbi:MAG: hypothetical protein DHS20C11_17990 [Lysobacteraceae bacterium]|nr:MAG: hypothetical protein DHS20C11_17990 [Xanthomonadaceae bacterium]